MDFSEEQNAKDKRTALSFVRMENRRRAELGLAPLPIETGKQLKRSFVKAYIDRLKFAHDEFVGQLKGKQQSSVER